MKQISILGCGWLGLPLAKSLIEKGFDIQGSTTSSEKMTLFKEIGINPFLIYLNEAQIEGNILEFLENSEILIIDIPPKLRSDSKENFVQKIKNLIPFIENAIVKKVIFVSSTSVYADENSIVTEQTIPKSKTESAKQLLQAEQFLQNNKNFKTTIIRFGGLIGEDRNPIHFLAGRKNIENPNASINLIHQKDCIEIIKRIIATNCWGEIFNAVAPLHKTRKEYYSQKAIELNLSLPEFDESKPSIGKTISSEKVMRVLNYTFSEF